jgi:pimeloyl-ACP methyl ester carboxylesterase
MILTHPLGNIHFWETGEGSPLVLLHGFLERSSMWDALLPAWSTNHRVVTIDLPGHGKSAVLGDTHSMASMAEVVRMVMDKLDIESAAITGHSMGGYVALAFAEYYPERIERLCLLCSTPLADSPERIANRAKALELVERDHRSFVRLTIPALFSATTRPTFKPAIENMIKEAVSFPARGIKAAIRGMMARPERVKVLKDLHIPKLIVCGEEDPIIPVLSMREIANKTNCDFLSLPGGHMLHLENQAEIVKIVHFIE